ncbi:YcjF family protein [Desulfovibrio porci]|uniref:YcjF family protein n=1 Tax=Desulfovibrio porci TaxID=2605782 RepID=UPI003A905380
MKNVDEQTPNSVEKMEEVQADATVHAVEAETKAHCVPAPDAIDGLIRKRVYAALAMGFVPVPLVDLAGFGVIQVEMLRALCKAHNISFQRQWVKSAISALCGSGVTVAAVPALSSLLKSIPLIGLTAGAATISLSGAATTYALGRVFDRHFRNGGTLKDFDADKCKTYFAEKMEEGKEYVKKLKPGKKQDAGQAAEEKTTPSEAV